MKKITREEIEQKYVVEKKPMHVVASELGIAVGTVFNRIKQYGIEARSKSDYEISDETREKFRNLKNAKGSKRTKEQRKLLSGKKFKGGIGYKKKHKAGYIMIYFPDHPCSTSDGLIMEHILVAEAIIGRHLHDDECVHHINGIKNDNRALNLKVMTKSEHMSFHSKKRHEERRGDDLSIQ